MLQNANDCTMLKGFRRVTSVEDFYEILCQIHDKDCLHAGSMKTFSRVHNYVHIVEPMTIYELYIHVISVGAVIVLLSTSKCGSKIHQFMFYM